MKQAVIISAEESCSTFFFLFLQWSEAEEHCPMTLFNIRNLSAFTLHMHTHCVTESKYCNCLIWAAQLFRTFFFWGQGHVFKFQLDGTVSHQRPCSNAVGCHSVLTHLPLCALLHIRASPRQLLALSGHAKKRGPSHHLHRFICEVKEMFQASVYFVVLFSRSSIGLVSWLQEEALQIYN